MKLIRVVAEYGFCYSNSFEFVLANAVYWDALKVRYVQGVVLSTETYERIGHCWVELTNPATGEEFCYEAVPHALVPKPEYYSRAEVSCVHRYEPERMISIAVNTGIGPWTEDICDNGLHGGEQRAPREAQELVQRARAAGVPTFEFD